MNDPAAMIPARFNLARHCLGAHTAGDPDKIALVVVADADAPAAEAERWTYSELDLAVRRVAAGLLLLGLAPGDRLLLRLPNNSDYALLFMGAIAAGLVPLPLSAQLTPEEAAFLLSDSDAAAVVQSAGLAMPPETTAGRVVLDEAAVGRLKSGEPLAAYADTAAEDPAYMIYTSGTTSRPKGVLHAHRVMLGRRPMHHDWLGLGPTDVMLHAGALNWSYTLGVGMLDPWACGATAVIYTGPKDVAVWPRLIRTFDATLFAAVPSLFRQILKYCALQPGDLPGLRHGLAAGEALSPAIGEQWRGATGTEIYEAFGMSECSTFVSTHPGMPIRPGSPGKPQTGRRIAVISATGAPELVPAGETGLLALHRREPGLMLGYWQRPDEDARAFRGDWFVGGDLVSFDLDGYLWHHGRADDVMNAGGYRVSPIEVETALADCPGLAEVAVAERRVREDVSVIAAYVVRKRDDLTAEALLAHAGERLASYKQPREVIFLDALPRSANGKLLRRQLAGLAAARS